MFLFLLIYLSIAGFSDTQQSRFLLKESLIDLEDFSLSWLSYE